MERTEVKSTTIGSVGYNDRTLEIQFKNGAIYKYADVPPEVYHGLLQAGSPGKYFYANIKGKYQTTKLGVQKAGSVQ